MGLPLAPGTDGDSRRLLRRGGCETGEKAGPAVAAPSHPPNASEELGEKYSSKCAGFAVGRRRIYPSVPAAVAVAESIRRGSEGSRGVLVRSRGTVGVSASHLTRRNSHGMLGSFGERCLPSAAPGGDGAVDTHSHSRPAT
ncbi:hypothetical protein PR202_gb05768 [Eleusine coracana subsp. coracana]|uniref:Uncharacterized protein n=1 Tax=Eleusine coracana subsp. coracana TaxID=191504 RepID=A0AAV5E682_ELECO|nr:hypothetical protein PR202_gb05768 [Eleusine coracana subsp. coracana]